MAPLDIKMHVLNTCVSASLTYGCETWRKRYLKKLEVLYRQRLKTALSIRNTVNNDIVYEESGEFPFSFRIAKQQLKFWKSTLKLREEKSDNYISKLIAAADGCTFLNYYQELQNQFNTPKRCIKHIKEEFINNTKEVIQNAVNDV